MSDRSGYLPALTVASATLEELAPAYTVTRCLPSITSGCATTCASSAQLFNSAVSLQMSRLTTHLAHVLRSILC